MSRIIPQVNMQVVAQPHQQNLATGGPSRSSQITSALLGLAGEGLKAYDKHLTATSARAEQEIAHELDVARKQDPRLAKMSFSEVMNENPVLRATVGKSLENHRSKESYWAGVETQWNQARDDVLAKEAHLDDYSRILTEGHNYALSGMDSDETVSRLAERATNLDYGEKTKMVNAVADGYAHTANLEALNKLKDHKDTSIESHLYIDNLIDQTNRAMAAAAKKRDGTLRFYEQYKRGLVANEADTNDARDSFVEQHIAKMKETTPDMTPQEVAYFEVRLQDEFNFTYNLPDKVRQGTYDRLIETPYIMGPDGEKALNPRFKDALAEYKRLEERGKLPLYMTPETVKFFGRYESLVDMGYSEEHAVTALANFDARGGAYAPLDYETQRQVDKALTGVENRADAYKRLTDAIKFNISVLGQPTKDAFKNATDLLDKSYVKVGGQLMQRDLNFTDERYDAVLRNARTISGVADDDNDVYLSFREAGFEGSAVLMRSNGSPYYKPNGTLAVIPDSEWQSVDFQSAGDITLNEEREAKWQKVKDFFTPEKPKDEGDRAKAMVDWAKQQQ